MTSMLVPDALTELAKPEHRNNPYPYLHWLRENDPVHLTNAGFYLVSKYDDVFYVLQHTGSAFTVPDEAQLRATVPVENHGHPSVERQLASFASKNRVNYSRLRAVMARDMTAARVHLLQPRIREHLNRLFDNVEPRLRAGEVVDMHTEVSAPMTRFIFTERVGFPAEDKEWISETIAKILPVMGPVSPEILAEADAASDEVEAYFQEKVSERRKNPKDDMLSRLIEVHDSYGFEDDYSLTGMLWIIWMTGTVSTIAGIDRGISAFMEHTQYHDWIRDDERNLSQFVEETIRHQAVGVYTAIPRIAVDDVDLADKTIPAGASVRLLIASANRDPEIFDDPDRFDPTRNTHRMLNMGHGIFYCSGAGLGRTEMAEMIRGLLERFPNLRAAGDPIWNPFIDTRIVDNLPARLV